MCTLYFSDDKVELLDPPSNSKPGECVFVEGYERETVGGKSDIYDVFTLYSLFCSCGGLVLEFFFFFSRDQHTKQKEKIVRKSPHSIELSCRPH